MDKIEKRTPGRPRKISSPEEFERLANSYVEKCMRENKKMTWTGLALALGLGSRDAINEYRNYPGFSDAVNRAKLLVENSYEENLHFSNAAGSIFALKNFGWRDSQEITMTGGVIHAHLVREFRGSLEGLSDAEVESFHAIENKRLEALKDEETENEQDK